MDLQERINRPGREEVLVATAMTTSFMLVLSQATSAGFMLTCHREGDLELTLDDLS